MYYHASQIADIEVLEPRISNHNPHSYIFRLKEKMC